jgi:ABC-type transport system substrate-binding protein
MALDRNAMLDAAFNLKDLEKLNIGATRRWNNDIATADASFWLDPEGKFQAKSADPKMTADNQKAFAYNPKDAKALLDSAGGGFTADLFTTSARYGNSFNILTELIQQYAKEIGINLELKDVDYNSVYITKIVVAKEFDGLLHIPRRTGVRGQFESFLPARVSNYGKIDDKDLQAKILAMYGELDPEKARTQVLDLQNMCNAQMYYIPMQLGAAGGFTGYQPGLNNVLQFQVKGQDWGNETVPYYWKA